MSQEADAPKYWTHAEPVCLQSASNVPAEFHTTFIFGKCLLSGAIPSCGSVSGGIVCTGEGILIISCFNADYWRAESALHWIEGDLERSQKLPWQKSTRARWNYCRRPEHTTSAGIAAH